MHLVAIFKNFSLILSPHSTFKCCFTTISLGFALQSTIAISCWPRLLVLKCLLTFYLTYHFSFLIIMLIIKWFLYSAHFNFEENSFFHKQPIARKVFLFDGHSPPKQLVAKFSTCYFSYKFPISNPKVVVF